MRCLGQRQASARHSGAWRPHLASGVSMSSGAALASESAPLSFRCRWYRSSDDSFAVDMNSDAVSGMSRGTESIISGCSVGPSTSESIESSSAEREAIAHSRIRIAFSSATPCRSCSAHAAAHSTARRL